VRLTLVTPPAEEPVTLAEARLHLAATEEDLVEDDPLIEALIVAARQVCELHLDRALITQTWDLHLDEWPHGPWGGQLGGIVLPRPPLQSITSITYTDTNGSLQTVPLANYYVRTGTPGEVSPIFGEFWPSARYQRDAIHVRFVAGYGTASAVPQCIKQAMLLLIAHWYRNREATVNTGAVPQKLEWSVDALLAPEQWGGYA
jgi:uncharacterized phiE125 gp8 family phage protein